MQFLKLGLITLIMSFSFSAFAEAELSEEILLQPAQELENQESFIDFLGLQNLIDEEAAGVESFSLNAQSDRRRGDRGRRGNGDRGRRGDRDRGRRGDRDRHRRGDRDRHRRGDRDRHRPPRHRRPPHRRDCRFWGNCGSRLPYRGYICVAENQWGDIFRARSASPKIGTKVSNESLLQ